MSEVKVTRGRTPPKNYEDCGHVKAEGKGLTIILPVTWDVFDNEEMIQRYIDGRLLLFHQMEIDRRWEEATGRTAPGTSIERGQCARYTQTQRPAAGVWHRVSVDVPMTERDWDVTDPEARLNAAVEELGLINKDSGSGAHWFIDPDRNAAGLAVYRPYELEGAATSLES